ncbi:hypothetical protein CDD81_785 [Ophiocordyceps australis]|uniref:Sulfotransferase domain-containing protein n=1 Tax=Ophiocordyceps australis TaxID=1399860 RepID=A0A2C5Y282_9HYPO|nr:hypothetical protein CDD81_785 [Ophiocordyceps australis]
MANQSAVGLPDRAVPMKVIVCGVHRTGSMSMRSALWRLGFHDCYHMHTVLSNLDDEPEQWIRAFEAKYAGKGTFSKADWDKLLGHSQACCDMPTAPFSVELAEMYPDAKVVILNRDPEAWYASVSNSIHCAVGPLELLRDQYCYLLDPLMRNWVRFYTTMVKLVLGYNHKTEKDKALAWFAAQYAHFRLHIAPHRRIEYSITDGWAPLCKHLDVPVPMQTNAKGQLEQVPFPRINDGTHFRANRQLYMSKSIKRANSNLFALAGRAALTGALGYAAYLACKTWLGPRPV